VSWFDPLYITVPLKRTDVYSPLCAQTTTAAQVQTMIVVAHLWYECVGGSGVEFRFKEKYKFFYTLIMPP